jgi:hypothetical protein
VDAEISRRFRELEYANAALARSVFTLTGDEARAERVGAIEREMRIRLDAEDLVAETERFLAADRPIERRLAALLTKARG